MDCEHRLLLNAISRLSGICSELEQQGEVPAEISTEELVELLGDLLTFLLDHFCAEEKLMKTCGLTAEEKGLCDRHMEDHAAISDTVLKIVSALDTPQTVPLARQLNSVMQNWLEHHIEIHDAALVQLITGTV